MSRINMPEFEDYRWFPTILRNMITDYLQFMYARSGLFRPLVPLLERALAETGSDRIVDLCSGAGGPVPYLQHCLESAGRPVEVTLTDKFPNLDAFEALRLTSNGRIAFVRESIDACNVPDSLAGLRTLFTGLHHLSPDMARQVLANAAHHGQGIGIFEVNERSVRAFCFALLVPFLVLLVTPFIRPLTWRRFLFTYAIPVVPLVTMSDGFASNLRAYSLKELQKLTAGIAVGSGGYIWEMGTIPARNGARITYLLGLPESQLDVRAGS